jgi:hypothetical protein
METFLKNLGEEFTWKNCLVECAQLFHTKVCAIMTKYINCENGILGCVEHHMCRYEVQYRLSLHAHIILWLHKDDVDSITNEILTFVPTIYDETLISFMEHVDLVENKLFKLMHRKQPKKCYKTRHDCKHGFPYAINK